VLLLFLWYNFQIKLIFRENNMQNIIELNIGELTLVSGGKKKQMKKPRKLGKSDTKRLSDTKKSVQSQGITTDTKYALAASGITFIVIAGILTYCVSFADPYHLTRLSTIDLSYLFAL
jgi:hypothetical protein